MCEKCCCCCSKDKPVDPKPPVESKPDDSKTDFKRWKITLPDGSENKDISKSLLPFYEIKNDVMTFTALPDGTTPNSKYSRSELREMKEGKPASWTTKEEHRMSFTFKVTEKPKTRPRVVIGQIHDTEDDVIMLLADFTKGIFEITHNSTKHGVLIKDIQLNTWYSITIATKDGEIVVTGPEGVKFSIKSNATGCYFKVGNYLQSREKGDLAVVEVKNLLVN